MNWPGLEPGDSQQYASLKKLERRFDRLIQALHESWPELNLEDHKLAEYRETLGDIRIRLTGNLEAYVWVEPEPDEEGTYLLICWYASGKRAARSLAQEAADKRDLRLSGVRSPNLDEYEWYIRRFSLDQVEDHPAEEQGNRIRTFVAETLRAMETCGILETEVS